MLLWRRIFFCLGIVVLVAVPTRVQCGSVGLTWTPPTTNMDGTVLTDLAGYRVYFGTESRNYYNFLSIGNITAYRVQNLIFGNEYCFAVTAYDTFGNESDYSNEVCKAVTQPGYFRMRRIK